MTDTFDQAAPVADPTYAELLTRAALRKGVWEGGNRGERKLVLLRLCDDANDKGVVTIELHPVAAELRFTTTHFKRLLSKLITRGDLTPLYRRFDIRTYQLSPRL